MYNTADQPDPARQGRKTYIFSENAYNHQVTKILHLFTRTRLLRLCGRTRVRTRTRTLRAGHLLVQSLPNLLLLCRP